MNRTLTIRLDREAALALEHLKEEFNEKAASKVVIRVIKEFEPARNDTISPGMTDEVKGLREDIALLRSELREFNVSRKPQSVPVVPEKNEPAKEPVTRQAPVESDAPVKERAEEKFESAFKSQEEIDKIFRQVKELWPAP